MTKILLILLSLSPVIANASLMFSPQEVKNILEKRAQNQGHMNRHSEDCLTCHGILFQNNDSWSVWINGEKLTSTCPQCRDGKIKMSHVDQSHAILEWDHNGTRHVVTLKPNESYDANHKSTISLQ